jgi:hypothetical protein
MFIAAGRDTCAFGQTQARTWLAILVKMPYVEVSLGTCIIQRVPAVQVVRMDDASYDDDAEQARRHSKKVAKVEFGSWSVAHGRALCRLMYNDFRRHMFPVCARRQSALGRRNERRPRCIVAMCHDRQCHESC